jgi:hypothetical protein
MWGSGIAFIAGAPYGNSLSVCLAIQILLRVAAACCSRSVAYVGVSVFASGGAPNPNRNSLISV